MHERTHRRSLLGAAAGALALAACKTSGAQLAPAATSESEPNAPVLPPEDLMREHGVLERVLLLYEDGRERLDTADRHMIEALAATADIAQHFVENYHQRLEEDWVFPALLRVSKQTDLVATLQRQHEAGRALTRQILDLTRGGALQRSETRAQLSHAMHRYVRMSRPHIAREDTVLFPAFRAAVTPLELNALGEQFEAKEHSLFGYGGFENVVTTVAELERALGIYDLKRFTAA